MLLKMYAVLNQLCLIDLANTHLFSRLSCLFSTSSKNSRNTYNTHRSLTIYAVGNLGMAWIKVGYI